MTILKQISDSSARLGLIYLICGGHAANYHGASRQTADLDLVIPKPQVESWKQLILGYNYSITQDSENFLQFTSSSTALWPLDLIVVDLDTFRGLSEESLEIELDDAVCRVISARHLICMKLHALRENYKARKYIDVPDILAITGAINLSVTSEEFRSLCLKYGNAEIYEELRTCC